MLTNVNSTYSNSRVLFKMDTDHIVLQTTELLLCPLMKCARVIEKMNLEEEAELDRILAGAGYVKGGEADEQPGPSPEQRGKRETAKYS